LHVVNAENDVNAGIIRTISLLKGDIKSGQLLICSECTNLIREIESYVWHPKCIEKGEDEPLKVNDHAVDALRYAVNTHKPARYEGSAKTLGSQNNQHWKPSNYYGYR
jgi:hypothetical protein